MNEMIEPVFLFDSHEHWFPVSIETVATEGALLIEPGHVTELDLDRLARLGVDPSTSEERLDFPAGMVQPADGAPVGYHRVRDAGGLWWHQFWLFYLYNPKCYAGFGEHEGDWEMVQLGCRDREGNVPILATCSQHDGGERREYWRVELAGGRPVIYVARDSHAHYFAKHADVTDQADGKGAVVSLEWREFGAWADWLGQWGNSQNSPGPLSTRRAWTAAHAYHSQARG